MNERTVAVALIIGGLACGAVLLYALGIVLGAL